MIQLGRDHLTLVIESEHSSVLAKVSYLLAEQNIQAYLVGGFVRDVLLGRNTADIDIAIAGDALEIAPGIAAVLGGRYVLLDEVNGIGRVVLASEAALTGGLRRYLDFSSIKGGIEDDLARRDFTIDAIAIDLKELNKDSIDIQLIDPFNGLSDLKRGIIRAVTDTAFESDPARLLRAVRLAAELGFSIDSETEALIRHYHHLVAGVSGERIREELLRLLAVPQAGQLLPYLEELGLLTAVIPELAQAKGVSQPKEHFWNVFEHSLQTVAATDFLLKHGDWPYATEDVLAAVPRSEALARHFCQEVSSGSTRRVLLKMAALLHDIAKPQTKAADNTGRVRFLGHAKEGAAIAVEILGRLRFSGREIKLVETVIRHHLRPMQMSQEGLPTRRAIYRYFRDTGDAGIDTLFLSLADHLATRGPHLNLAHWEEHARLAEYVMAQYLEKERPVTSPKLVDGHDLINIFGMSPGPGIGEILEAVREAQAAGELTTRQEALAHIRKHLLTKVER